MSMSSSARPMRESHISVSPVVAISGAGVFGALASLITIAVGPTLQPSFPILFYLKFDLAEVVDMIAFFVFGPVAGVLTATVHFVILSFAPGGTGLFGASLKYFAVLATYAGVMLVSRVGKFSFRRAGISMTFSGLVVRVVLMTFVNYLYLILLAKTIFNVDYEAFAQFVLSSAGISLAGSGFVTYVLGLTAIFNAVHAIFSVALSLFIVRILMRRAPQWLETRAWLTNYIVRRFE